MPTMYQEVLATTKFGDVKVTITEATHIRVSADKPSFLTWRNHKYFCSLHLYCYDGVWKPKLQKCFAWSCSSATVAPNGRCSGCNGPLSEDHHAFEARRHLATNDKIGSTVLASLKEAMLEAAIKVATTMPDRVDTAQRDSLTRELANIDSTIRDKEAALVELKAHRFRIQRQLDPFMGMLADAFEEKS